MENHSIFTVLFVLFAGLSSGLILGNATLLILRFLHEGKSPVAEFIREVGRQLWFLRLGGKNTRDA